MDSLEYLVKSAMSEHDVLHDARLKRYEADLNAGAYEDINNLHDLAKQDPKTIAARRGILGGLTGAGLGALLSHAGGVGTMGTNALAGGLALGGLGAYSGFKAPEGHRRKLELLATGEPHDSFAMYPHPDRPEGSFGSVEDHFTRRPLTTEQRHYIKKLLDS